jgi:hypothetical protein
MEVLTTYYAYTAWNVQQLPYWMAVYVTYPHLGATPIHVHHAG